MLIYAVLAIVLCIVITNPAFLKFKAGTPFKQDKLIQKEKDERKLTFLYKFGTSVKETTSDNISRYTIISDNGNRSLIVTYEKKFKNIIYYIYMYSLSNKLIGVLEVEEHASKLNSETIDLPKTCKKINIVVSKADDEEFDMTVIKTVSFPKLLLYTIFETACLGSVILFCVEAFLSPTDTNLMGMTTITSVLCFVNFIVVLLILCKRNRMRK